MLAMTRPSSTSGEPAAPKKPLRTPNRRIVSTLQMRLPVAEVDGVQLSFSAEGVDPAVRDDGDGARPFVEPEIVAVGGRICVAPARVARPRVERFDDFFVPTR